MNKIGPHIAILITIIVLELRLRPARTRCRRSNFTDFVFPAIY
jgi:hypothetical protein